MDDDGLDQVRRKDAGPLGPRATRSRSAGEHRWPPAVATLTAIACYLFLPSSLQVGSKYLIAGLEGLLLLALLVTNPVRMAKQSKWSRIASVVLACIVILSNLASLVLLVAQLGSDEDGMKMLLGAMQVWATGVIGYALLYWEVDRGGPVVRRRAPRGEVPLADWRFSQDENRDTVQEVKHGSSETADWVPEFIDYFYMSLTNSSAFSPTDTMPLSSRAKLLMGSQATAALLTSLLVVARAVGSFGN